MSSALFSPIRLAGLELSNRVVVSPMCQYSADDGCANDWHLMHLGMLANSGAGLVVVEATHVERHGRITHGCLGLYSDDNEAALARVVSQARRRGTAKFGIQIAHSGRKGSAQRPWDGGGALQAAEDPWQTIAASAAAVRRQLAYAARGDRGRPRPRARRLRQRRQARAAHRLRRHRTAHGARLSAARLHVAVVEQAHRSIRRQLREPLRFPLSVARAVRAVVPKEVPLGARITGSDWRDGGLTPDDAVAIAKALKAEGLDFICVSSGGVALDIRNPSEPGYNLPMAARVKREAGIATRAVGLIVTPEQAEAAVAKGEADMVALGRALLDDPHWGWHAAKALGAEVELPRQYLRAGPKLWAPAAKG